MDMIKMLPQEIENKIFYMIAEHPCSKIIKDEYKRLLNKSRSDESEFDFENAFNNENYERINNRDFCHKNGRIISVNYFIRTGDYMCLKCLDKVKLENYNDYNDE